MTTTEETLVQQNAQAPQEEVSEVNTTTDNNPELEETKELEEPSEPFTQKNYNEKVEEARQATMEMIKSVVENLREQNMILINAADNGDSSITIGQLNESRSIIADIDLLQDPLSLAKFLRSSKDARIIDPLPTVYQLSSPININSLKIDKFRSICRANSVNQLKIKETCKMIEEISDIRTKAVFRALIHSVVYRFSSKDVVQEHTTLLKLFLMVLRTSIKVRVLPSVSEFIFKV